MRHLAQHSMRSGRPASYQGDSHRDEWQDPAGEQAVAG
jgi:hypothetical protein